MKSVFRTCVVALMGFLVTAVVPAQEPGEQINGTIAAVDLQGSGPRTLKITRDDGSELSVVIANRTRVSFQAAGYPNADLTYLKPGLGVRFRYSAGVIDRVIVTGVPDDYEPPKEAPAEPPRTTPAPKGPETREVKARILESQSRTGFFQADVAGRRETFQLKDPGLLRRFQPGDLVMLTLERSGNDEVVTKIALAITSGRVVSVDRRRGQVTITVDGREETFGVDDKELLRDIRPGDFVRVAVEERPRGLRVITEFH